jgi:NAD(P)-dependent dehydrogenase (short-subunit alcohol dehydrogenase family)
MAIGMFNNDFDFTGKRVLITGAAGGLGQALSHAFSLHGADLVLADLEREALEQCAAHLPRGVEFHVFDQGSLQSIADLTAKVGVTDILINNAAMLLVKPILDCEPEEIEKLISVNLIGPMVLARGIASSMIARHREGVVINICSQLAFCGAEGRAAYSTAKAGIAQYTKSAAVEWAPHGIRVVGIAPGRLLTKMSTFLGKDAEAYKAGIARVPAGRYGTPEEIAKLVLVLASPCASYMVGETVLVDGGYVLG